MSDLTLQSEQLLMIAEHLRLIQREAMAVAMSDGRLPQAEREEGVLLCDGLLGGFHTAEETGDGGQ